jgi:hypothetical protein
VAGPSSVPLERKKEVRPNPGGDWPDLSESTPLIGSLMLHSTPDGLDREDPQRLEASSQSDEPPGLGWRRPGAVGPGMGQDASQLVWSQRSAASHRGVLDSGRLLDDTAIASRLTFSSGNSSDD